MTAAVNDKNIAYIAACLAEYATRGKCLKEIKELQVFLSIFEASVRAIFQMRSLE
jgi:hypothetical protein